jgi:hypothetical protein
MGNLREWVETVILAIFFGGVSLLWGWYRGPQAVVRRTPSASDIIGWSLMGLCFGLLMVFGWRAFSWPVVLITAPALAIGFLTGPYGLKVLKRIRGASSA